MKRNFLILLFIIVFAKSFSEEAQDCNSFSYFKTGIGMPTLKYPIPAELQLGFGHRVYNESVGLDTSFSLSTIAFITIGANVSENLLFYPFGAENRFYIGPGLTASILHLPKLPFGDYGMPSQNIFRTLGNIVLGWQFKTAKNQDRFIQFEIGHPILTSDFKEFKWAKNPINSSLKNYHAQFTYGF